MGAFTVSVGGKQYDVDAPDENTAWKWAKATHLQEIKSEGQQVKPPTPFKTSGDTALSSGEEFLANPYGRAAVGMAKPVIGIGQLGLNIVGQGGDINREMGNLQQSTDKARAYVGSSGVDVADIAGQVLSPVNLAAGALLPNATSTVGRIGQGMMFGGASGAAAPVSDPENYWRDKMAQIGIGISAGGVIPGLWEGSKAIGRGARNVLQPYLGQSGADAAAGRVAVNVSNGKADEIIRNLENPQVFVRGSNPTAAQAAAPANSAEFSALGKIVAERNPSVNYGPKGISGEQNAARLSAVRDVARTPADLAAAEAQRASDAVLNYGAAYNQAIKADPRLMQLSRNPYFQDALKDAEKLAEATGVNPKQGLTHFLHYVKVSLDKQLGKTGDTALGNTEKMVVQNLKKELTNWMGAKNPAYELARQEFAKASIPINQMQVGQYLEQKLIPALSEETKQRAATYAQALRDAPGTIKKSTGQGVSDDLGDILTSGQLDKLKGVQSDLARDATVSDLASKGMKSAQERIGRATPEAPPTGMFSPILSVARGAYNRLTGKASDRILDDIEILMRNPQQMAKVMRDAKPYERRAIVDAMMRYQSVLGPTSVEANKKQ